MRLSLLYNPLVMIDRLAIEINRFKRKRKLKGTPASGLSLGHLDSLELLALIKKEGFIPKTIFDAGANIGTWTLLAKSIFPQANVFAFEPLQVHLENLQANLLPLQDIHIQPFCLGSENTTTRINVSSFSDSSSILPATDLEYQQFNIQKVREETTDVKRVDTLISNGHIQPAELIKLDVQGYELEVLKGFGETLHGVKYIISEVSFQEYYKGQALFLDMANYLATYDFSIYAFGNATPTGQQLGQIDVLFKNIG